MLYLNGKEAKLQVKVLQKLLQSKWNAEGRQNPTGM